MQATITAVPTREAPLKDGNVIHLFGKGENKSEKKT
jgi:hypothetical protein